jgi:predicted mannosyl-3-phosphoglycerate phosphatase (HAD superfamily)
MKEKVSIIRMLSGVEIICVISKGGTDQVLVKDPLVVQFQSAGENGTAVSLAFGQLAPFAKKKSGEPELIALNSYLIEFDYEADDEIAEKYLQYTNQKNSRLILPKDSGKIVKP